MAPKTLAPGWVRSGCPMRAPVGAPLGGVDVLAAQAWHRSWVLLRVNGPQPSYARACGGVHVDKHPHGAFRHLEDPRPLGETPRAMFRHRAKDPCRAWPQTLGRDSRTRRTNDVETVELGRGRRRRRLRWRFPRWPRPTHWTPPSNGALPDSVAINSIWVVVAALLVIFMQAGFAFLEIGFSRGKNAGTVVAKILTNFSIAAIAVLGGRLRASPSATASSSVDAGLLPARLRRSAEGVRRSMGLSDATIESKWLFQFIVLRRLAGDRLGHDARAHQVRRLRHLRRRVRRPDLPDRLALGLRRRLAADQPRHAGLRRLDRGPPDRRHRRARGAAAARRRAAASTARTARRGRSRATTCRCSASAC